jgi:hypothetical protein
VKRGFEIVYQEHGLGGALYSVRFEGEEKSELDKFLEDRRIQASKDFDSLVSRLEDMVDSFGFKEHFFKIREGSIRDSLAAFHYDNGPLRLFCLRWSSVLLIAGSGGIKRTRTYQDDGVLRDAAEKLQRIDELIQARQKSRDIIIDATTGMMAGNLNFYI